MAARDPQMMELSVLRARIRLLRTELREHGGSPEVMRAASDELAYIARRAMDVAVDLREKAGGGSPWAT